MIGTQKGASRGPPCFSPCGSKHSIANTFAFNIGKVALGRRLPRQNLVFGSKMDMNIVHELCYNITTCIETCIQSLRDGAALDLLLTRIESIQAAVISVHQFQPLQWGPHVIELLESTISIILSELDQVSTGHSGTAVRAGRPAYQIPLSSIEYFLSIQFKVPDIAKFYGVSRNTIFRRMRTSGLSVNPLYSSKIKCYEMQGRYDL